MPSPSDARYVWLRSGLPVRLSRDGNLIWIRPFSTLTDQDRSQIKLWKGHLLALLDDQAPAPEVQ